MDHIENTTSSSLVLLHVDSPAVPLLLRVNLLLWKRVYIAIA
jgi:hypothetical protein